MISYDIYFSIYAFIPTVQGSGKIGKHVDFENGIQLPCSEEPKKLIPYSLHGIIVHHGGSVHSGHYVAYIKVLLATYKTKD